eukprot:1775107-Pyramimonas_sp.AAC.1
MALASWSTAALLAWIASIIWPISEPVVPAEADGSTRGAFTLVADSPFSFGTSLGGPHGAPLAAFMRASALASLAAFFFCWACFSISVSGRVQAVAPHLRHFA